MTLVETLLGRPRNATLEGTLPLTSTTLVEVLGWDKKSHAGIHVDEKSAMGLSAVWRAVNLISGTAAGLPLHAYTDLPDGGRERIEPGDPAADLLDDPHPDMTPFELYELGYQSLCMWGNTAFWKLRDRSGVLRDLWWIEPSRIRYGRAKDGTKVYVVDGDEENAVGDARILHIPGFGYDGVCGVSPIRAARQGLALGLAAEQFGAKLFANGSLATGVLQVEQRLDTEAATEIKKLWKAGGSGLDGAHDVRVVGSGAKFERLTIPPEDAQFLQTREFQVTEVARWFGIPPHMLAQVDKSTSWGSGIEVQQIAMVTYTFGSWLTRWEQRFSKMLREVERPLTDSTSGRRYASRGPRRYAKYALQGLLRGDSKSRAEFYKAMWDIGALSTNDVRRLEDMPPVEGGDVRYVPLNYGRLGDPAVDSTADQAVDPAAGGQESGPAEPAAATAAKVAQQAYLAVGKVLGVDEARALVRAAGADLDDRTAAEVFAADLPPAPGGGAPAFNASDAGRVLASARGARPVVDGQLDLDLGVDSGAAIEGTTS